MKTIAIFGAGPALGLAIARRFGREGYQAALVARDRAHLDDLVGELARDGIAAAGFQADLTDRVAALAAVDAIEAKLGPVDVLEYSPTPGVNPGTGPSRIDPDAVAEVLQETGANTAPDSRDDPTDRDDKVEDEATRPG